MSDERPPHSPLKRFVRGVAFFFGGLFLICLGLWLWGALTFGPRLQQRLSALQQAGEPITIIEAEPTPIPPPRNAATQYMALFGVHFEPGSKTPDGLMGLSGADLDRLDRDRAAATPEALADLGPLLARPSVRAGLAGLREAAGKPVAVFPIRWGDGFSALFPHLAKFRAAERLVMAQALVSASAGQRDQAADWLWVGLRLPRHTAQEPALIAQLVTYALYGMVADTMPKVLAHGDLPPAAVARLQAELAAPWLNDDLRRSLLTERVMVLDSLQRAAREPEKLVQTLDPDSSSPLAPTLTFLSRSLFARPFWQLQQLLYLDHMSQVIPPALADARTAPRVPQPQFRPWDMSSLFLPVFGKTGRHRDQCQAWLGMMRLGLMLSEYHAAHASYPASLSELGPDLPQDPFSGKSFVYHNPSPATGPSAPTYLLYSLGANLQDDGGTVAEKKSDRLESGDLVWGK